jgi:hypothetical protein
MLFNRNIISTISKCDKIFNEEMCNYKDYNYKDEVKRFTEVEQIIKDRLVLSSLLAFKESRLSKSKRDLHSKSNSKIKNS